MPTALTFVNLDDSATTTEYVIVAQRRALRTPVHTPGGPITSLADAQQALANCQTACQAEIANYEDAVTNPATQEDLDYLDMHKIIVADLRATTHTIFERTTTAWTLTKSPA